MSTDLLADLDGPGSDDLAAIDAEWPLIEAELAVVDAEIRLALLDRPTLLDWRRLRRAEQRACREMAAHLDRVQATRLHDSTSPDVRSAERRASQAA